MIQQKQVKFVYTSWHQNNHMVNNYHTNILRDL